MSPAGFPGEDEVHPPSPPKFKVTVGRPVSGDLSGTYPLQPTMNLADVTIEAINAELTRRFQGVALIAIQVGPDGVTRDLYYTSTRHLPMPMLAGCVTKLAADLQASVARVEIKPT
jgi:hypothetical protein